MNRKLRDVVVGVISLAIVGVLMAIDLSNLAILQALMGSLLFVGVTHLTRRILLPDLDLQKIATKASETSSGAGVVFATIVAYLATITWLSLNMLK